MQLSIPTPIPPNTTHLPSLKLALICGGTGAEHIGSIESALWLLSQFRPDHQPGFFYQYPDGRLAEAAELPALFETWAVHPYIKAWIDPAGAEHCRAVFRKATHWTGPAWTALTSGSWDLIWPAFHGQGGEDGSIQGLLEFLGLAYGGCNLEGSALGIDKILTKQCCEAVGLAVAPWAAIDSAAWARDPAACLERCRPLGLPLFIKPARLGSSIGLSRITRFEDLAPAIQAGLNWDSRILIEAQVQGIEYGIGIVGNQAQPMISAVAESTLHSDSYDYEAKYSADALDDIVPARLDADTTARLQDFALKAWQALDMCGLARIDCFLGPHGPILNEVNTMPGLSAWAPFVMAWRHIGVNAPGLMDLIVQEALNRNLVSDRKRADNIVLTN